MTYDIAFFGGAGETQFKLKRRMEMDTQDILKKIDERRDAVGAERDRLDEVILELDEAILELEGLRDCCQRAHDCLQDARDAL